MVIWSDTIMFSPFVPLRTFQALLSYFLSLNILVEKFEVSSISFIEGDLFLCLDARILSSLFKFW